MSRSRFILEAEWSGYRSAQRRVVHREIVSGDRMKYEAIHAIRFTDGTTLDIRVRDAGRTKVETILGYSNVLHTAARKGLEGFIDVRDCA